MTSKLASPIEPIISVIKIKKKKSPTLFIKKTLNAAFILRTRSDQKLTKNNDVNAIPSQPK